METIQDQPNPLQRFLDFIADKLIPMDFVIVDIDTPQENTTANQRGKR